MASPLDVRSPAPVTALLALAVVVLAGCGDGGEDGATSGGGGGGSTTDATTVGSTNATTGSSSGDGGATTGTTGAGGEDATTGAGGEGGEGGGIPTCDGAIAGAPCDVEGTTCEELVGQGLCEEGLPRITSCTDGRWEVWVAISCGPLVTDPSCALPGRYLVEPSGPFEPEEGTWLTYGYGEPFELVLEVRDDGRLYASAEIGWTEPGSCDVRAGWTLEESCEEIEGESFCTTIERSVDLSLSEDPGVGTVELECWGECGETATAPVTATRL